METEKILYKFGLEVPDKNVERTCGNCVHFMDKTGHGLGLCSVADDDDTSFYKAKDSGCYQHRTQQEQELIADAVRKSQENTLLAHIESCRKNGTGFCGGCPYREQALKEGQDDLR